MEFIKRDLYLNRLIDDVMEVRRLMYGTRDIDRHHIY